MNAVKTIHPIDNYQHYESEGRREFRLRITTLAP